MLRDITSLARGCQYDFRPTASPNDQLHYLFDEWVPYYRTKWATARYLRPGRILEIGVRYGYSALAFLNACPSAEYVGIELDTDSYGGEAGALNWARQKTALYNAQFIVADSQKFDRFPGGDYDLIHIDGQQDEKGFEHDMEVALRQASHVLVDGYFWTRENFLTASEFLFRNRDLIEFYGVIPGYAGDLLIARKETPKSGSGAVCTSADIRGAYTKHYYLGDCGGFDSFKRTRGTKLEDGRLRTVAQLADLATRGRALDLGCGRGELSIALARAGFETAGIDYSADAIALAEDAKAATEDPSLNLKFICSDVARAPLEGTYDLVVAADLIEHLAPQELDKLYKKVAGHLAPDGLFVLHTFPNLWYYRYEHARKRHLAQSVGAYLPANARSRYERLMHINEQSPRVLRRQLRGYFPHVLLWFSDHELSAPYENLRRRFSIAEMRRSGDLFAIASKRHLDVASVLAHFRMQPIDALSTGDLLVRTVRAPAMVQPESKFDVDLIVTNRSKVPLKSFPPNPVHLSYHWIEGNSGQVAILDGTRTLLEPPLDGQSERRYRMSVTAPMNPADYILRATLVQESCGWFDAGPVGAFSDKCVKVGDQNPGARPKRSMISDERKGNPDVDEQGEHRADRRGSEAA